MDIKLGLEDKYFWPLSVQGQAEFIQYISDIAYFRQPCILKPADRRAKWAQIWALGVTS